MQQYTQQLLAGGNRALCQICEEDYGQLGGIKLIASFSTDQISKFEKKLREKMLKGHVKLTYSGKKAFSPNACVILNENWRQKTTPELGEVLGCLC